MATVNKQAIAAAFGRAAAHYEQHADLQRQSADALLAMLPQRDGLNMMLIMHAVQRLFDFIWR